MTITLFPSQTLSQPNCDPNVPSFNVDLSTKVDSNWISPDTVREGLCCGASSPDRCIAFEVTLHPDATGIIFDIHSGAEPPGALFYQVGCSAPTQVGEPLCLSGPGPHMITFCKPGSNVNEYSLQSIPPAEAGPPVSIHDGCADSLFAFGFEDSTLRWNSIYPDSTGDHNSYMSCDSACDTTIVTPQPGFPDTVLYEVCGDPIGGCDSMPMCDTVAVYYTPTIDVTINPGDPAVCYGDTTTPIVANGSGGAPPYNFDWSTGETGDTIHVPPGTYWVEITDSSNCPPAYDTAVVEEFTSPIEANAGPDQELCVQDLPADLSGSVTFAKGGTWFGGNGSYSPSQDSLDISYDPTSQEIAADSLELYLATTGNNFCEPDTDTVVLGFIPTPLPTLSDTDVTCNGNADGKAAVSLAGDAASHSFSWDGGGFQQGDSSITGLDTGSHSVSIQDSNGCDTTLNFTITQPAPLQVAVTDSAPVSCTGGSDGWAYSQASGGTPPYSYQWNSNPSQTGDSATGLSAGSYVVEVTDSNGCTAFDTVLITEPPPLEVDIVDKKNVSCNGGSDAYAVANATGGVGGYSYSWNTSPAQSGDSATGLPIGSYVVEATDSNGCSATDTVQITEPPPMAVDIIDSLDVSCTNGSDGYAVAAASGGVGDYSYSWNTSPVQSGDSATGLSAGTYVVEATDSNGCSATDTVPISEPPPLVVNIVAQQDASCDGSADGYAVADATGGTGSYSFSWNTNPVQTTDSASGLDSNSYTVVVEDSLGCTDTSDVLISDPAPLDLDLQNTDVSCFGGSDGSATATATGGTAPYSYSWNTNPTQTGSTATGLSAGTYAVTVTDDQGCTYQDSTVIDEPSQLIVQSSKTNVTCNGNDDGKGTALPSGGTPPYSYSWNSNPPSSDSTVDSLAPGNYQVIVTDSLGCQDSSSISISEPPPLQLSSNVEDAICNGDSNGSLQVNASGGNPSYSFNWGAPIQGQSGPSVDSLPAGTYQVVASDSLGCTDTLSMTVEEPQPMEVSSGPPDSICRGEQANLSASSSGGNGGSSYLWQPDSMSGANQSVSPANSTVYTVTATDSLGCSSPADSTFIFVMNLKNDTLNAMAETAGVCIGDTAVLSGEYGGEWVGVDFMWTPTGDTALTPHTHVPDSTTQYVLTATNSCSDTIRDTVEVEVYPLPDLDPEQSEEFGCPPLEVSFENASGDSSYSYEWDFGDGNSSTESAPTHVYRNSGTYDVSMTATSDKGCVDSTGIFGEVFVYAEPIADFEPSPSRADMMAPDVDFEDRSFGAEEYLWDFGDNSTDTAASPSHTYEHPDEYLVQQIVWNSYGCSDTTTQPLLVDPKVSVYIPNAFKPNGNGVNDEFYPVMRGVKARTFEMQIFDRWGELIFESHHPDVHWKGDAKGDGQPVKPDVYVYKVTVEDIFGKKHEYVGHVTVVR